MNFFTIEDAIKLVKPLLSDDERIVDVDIINDIPDKLDLISRVIVINDYHICWRYSIFNDGTIMRGILDNDYNNWHKVGTFKWN